MQNIELIATISAGLGAALVLGLATQRVGLSPIVGYLLAGIAVGPHTPGFVADEHIARQLAELGVVLLMFGVGLHFHLDDLMAVRSIAIPGAIGQIAVATALGAAMALAFGWSLPAGIVLGIAISVASTVVLIRVLSDAGVMDTQQGHIAIGWLVVEDLFTVIALVMLPALAGALGVGEAAGDGHGPATATDAWGVLKTLGIALGNLALMVVLIVVAGARLIPWLLEYVARTRSRELFTLAVLAVAVGIAVGSAMLFGASMALGAFLAGTVVGRSEASHQAAADALPLRDAFAVLFFVSVGMLFDPSFLLTHPVMTLVALGIILVGKPLSAMVIVLLFRYPLRTALTVGLALAQIGEFSFILAEQSVGLKILPPEGFSLMVACALISITLNPPLFRQVRWFENRLTPRGQVAPIEPVHPNSQVSAVVAGYGPVGKTLARILRDFGIKPVIIDLNVDTVKKLNASGEKAIYGDAARRDILEAAGIGQASYLVVTLPDLAGRIPVVALAKQINPKIRAIVRAHYLAERVMLEETGADAIAYEEAESAIALAGHLLKEIGASEADISAEAARLRTELGAGGSSTLKAIR